MKITKRQLKQIIKEERAKLISESMRDDYAEMGNFDAARINAEQSGLQSQAEVTRLMGELHNIIERLINTLGTDEVALELEGIAEDLMGN